MLRAMPRTLGPRAADDAPGALLERECIRAVLTAATTRTVQELLGHASVTTTMIYTHVLNRGPTGVRSPADRLFDA